jgi:hypothetical protein
MTWNYRVIDMTEKLGIPCFVVAEVYYNADDTPVGYSETGVDGEDIKEIKQTLKAMKRALKDEVLQVSFFENLDNEYEPEVGNEL